MIKIANEELQHYKYLVHKYLDYIWLQSSNKGKSRSTMYNWLSVKMNLSREETHVSKFNMEQCLQAIKILKPMYIQMGGKDDGIEKYIDKCVDEKEKELKEEKELILTMSNDGAFVVNSKFEFVERVKVFGDDKIKLPNRSTKGSAGYDFYYNDIEDTIIKPNEIVYVKTGIKVRFPDSIALLLLNRSSNPKKKGLILVNGVGLIDSDYYNNEDNEGEIAFAFLNRKQEEVVIKNGDKLGQGMFVPFALLAVEDEVESTRQGGFGSTDAKN